MSLSVMPLLPSLLASLLLGAAAIPASSAPFAAERWNKRIVVAFADRQDDRLKRQVEDLLNDRSALAERDMLVIAVAGNEASAPFGAAPARLSASALREAYDVPSGTPFTVILLGKDGGEKLRRTDRVAARDILGLIDSMPMRRSEANGD